MGLLARLSKRIPRSMAIVTMGIAGIFGIRTPPDPEVVAQTAPAPQAVGAGGGRLYRDERCSEGEEAAQEKNAPDR